MASGKVKDGFDNGTYKKRIGGDAYKKQGQRMQSPKLLFSLGDCVSIRREISERDYDETLDIDLSSSGVRVLWGNDTEGLCDAREACKGVLRGSCISSAQNGCDDFENN